MFQAYTLPEENMQGFVIQFPNGYAVSVAFKDGESIARTAVSYSSRGNVRIVSLAGRENVQWDDEEGVAELMMRVACLPSEELKSA